MLLFMLKALHIAEQTSNEQCWEVSNQMNEIYEFHVAKQVLLLYVCFS